MAVFRVEKTKDFTIMSNHHLRNTELSLKAKPCHKDHVFFCFRHRLAVQNFYFDLFNWYVPPLQSLSVRTDSSDCL